MQILKVKMLLLLVVTFYVELSGQSGYTTSSSKAIKNYEEGKAKYRLYNYQEAEKLLKKAIKTDEQFIEPHIVLARMYWEMDSLQLAIDSYSKGLAIDPVFYTNGYIYKGNLELKTGKYSIALESFNNLLTYEKKNKKLINLARKGIEKAEFAIEAKKKPVKFTPVLLDTTINSADDEYWPSLSADEQTLVFTRLVGSSKRQKKVQEDFYISTKQNNGWTLAKSMGKPLNTYDNEGAQSISADGNLMVYTVCNRRGVIGRCDLYLSAKRGNNWSIPQNMGRVVNSVAKETQPSLSADGRTVYFVSDRGGGKGGLDIWATKLNAQGIWEVPVNLGDSINTPGNEISPYIHHDNKTLYFSSDHYSGMGGYDIFYSRKNAKNEWIKPVNIGYPINTHKDEIGLIIAAKGNMAYYSTNINPERGRDIYQFELYEEARPVPVSYMKGKVFDANNRRVLKAEFELYDLESGELISNSYSDSYTGEFLVCVPTGKDYMLNVSKEGYLFFSENFSFTGVHDAAEPYHKDVPLQPILAGKTIILRNIFFETGSYTLKQESQTELNKLVKFLKVNSEIKVEISGHTDNIGTEAYNQKLSEQRAGAVVEYIISEGVPSGRLIPKGYGYSKPVETNDTEEGRANNRRTELKIIK